MHFDGLSANGWKGRARFGRLSVSGEECSTRFDGLSANGLRSECIVMQGGCSGDGLLRTRKVARTASGIARVERSSAGLSIHGGMRADKL